MVGWEMLVSELKQLMKFGEVNKNHRSVFLASTSLDISVNWCWQMLLAEVVAPSILSKLHYLLKINFISERELPITPEVDLNGTIWCGPGSFLWCGPQFVMPFYFIVFIYLIYIQNEIYLEILTKSIIFSWNAIYTKLGKKQWSLL